MSLHNNKAIPNQLQKNPDNNKKQLPTEYLPLLPKCHSVVTSPRTSPILCFVINVRFIVILLGLSTLDLHSIVLLLF